MRRLLGVTLAVCLLAALASAAASARVSGPAAKEWASRIAAVGPRPAGYSKERRAGAIVARRLERLGYTVTRQRFRVPGGRKSQNIVGRTGGRPRVIVVAHIDGVYGTRAANDNASGVGLLIHLARFLADENGVLLAALGAEERAVTGSSRHLGSRRLRRSLSARERSAVRLAVSMDMVGVGATLHVRGLESAPNRSARRVLRSARRLGIRASYLRDTGQSDHDELTRGGMQAAWVQWRWDTCWHEPCDAVSRLRPNRLRRAGRIVLNAALTTLR